MSSRLVAAYRHFRNEAKLVDPDSEVVVVVTKGDESTALYPPEWELTKLSDTLTAAAAKAGTPGVATTIID